MRWADKSEGRAFYLSAKGNSIVNFVGQISGVGGSTETEMRKKILFQDFCG